MNGFVHPQLSGLLAKTNSPPLKLLFSYWKNRKFVALSVDQFTNMLRAVLLGAKISCAKLSSHSFCKVVSLLLPVRACRQKTLRLKVTRAVLATLATFCGTTKFAVSLSRHYKTRGGLNTSVWDLERHCSQPGENGIGSVQPTGFADKPLSSSCGISLQFASS